MHADAARLSKTLEKLGYQLVDGIWQHPERRIAAFLGDFIDTGRDNRKVIEQVRTMVKAGNAIAVMGNHELNALHYHTPGKNWLNTDDGFMRAHDDKNRGQHQSFLDEYPVGSAEAQDVMNWFLTLPLFLELEGLRLVHACWDARHVDLVEKRWSDGRLKAEDLQEVAFERTDFAQAVVNLVKGPEATLPSGCGFHDYRRTWREKARIKWWADPAGANWRDATLSVPNPLELPDSSIEGKLDCAFYAPDAPPVFFGHYKRTGLPLVPDAPNVICLDYPAHACAYRWEGEPVLSAAGIVLI
ncbi:metallophosphoesterase [Sulfitobacter sediminilitoris]|uniref:metallophosphoesterase n=1 Tax=Sulfitobacter sediminilitoris TaxID=2698830 RepID=UPI002E2C04C4|nr:metallophosphoesterase [Sulfitobacter sediminilitoris]